jgi:RNA recognition motif-containing protein
MSQSLSSLFQSGDATKSTTESSSSLGGLFSDAAQKKFARIYRPEEFEVPVKKAKPVPEPTEAEDAKKKKRKRKVEEAAAEGTEEQSVDAAVEDSKVGDRDTIFVGNIPITESTKSLTKFFKTYGEIDSIRLRSVPVAGAKVDEAGNQDLVRKVCVNSKKFGEQKGSFNAYIKFKEVNSVAQALGANNTLMGERHIRVDKATPTLFDPKKSVFLGNLPHYADEEDIREFFAKVIIVLLLWLAFDELKLNRMNCTIYFLSVMNYYARVDIFLLFCHTRQCQMAMMILQACESFATPQLW